MEQSCTISSPIGREQESSRRLFDLALSLLKPALQLTGLWNRGKDNALTVSIQKLDLHFDNLPPAFDGYRLLHLTDLHLDALDGLTDRISDAIDLCDYDLCILTGDYQEDYDAADHLAPLLHKLFQRIKAPDGVYAVPGNHDSSALVKIMSDIGFGMLLNDQVTIKRGDQFIGLSGTDDVHRFYTEAAAETLASRPAPFSIALVHSPEMAEEAASGGYALYLCGHCHGGQICLPGGKPIVTHLHKNKPLAKGLWQRQNMTGYTSSGAGVSGIPVRFFSRGEITQITLRRC